MICSASSFFPRGMEPSFGFETDRLSLWKWCCLRGAGHILWHCVLTVFCERRSLLYGEHFEKLCSLFIIERGPGVSKIAFENVMTASPARPVVENGVLEFRVV